MEFAEALAHQMRGMTIMYFLIWNVHLYNYRKQNRMMKFLFIATLFLTFGFLKDSIFLAETLQYNLTAQVHHRYHIPPVCKDCPACLVQAQCPCCRLQERLRSR